MRHQFRLIQRLGGILERAMTRDGHLAQIVPWEHRGTCSAQKGCTTECLEAQALRALVTSFLEPSPRPVPAAAVIARRARRAVTPMQRRARAVPGRRLPSTAVRLRVAGGAV